MVCKKYIVLVIAFCLSVLGSSDAYTREDLENWRTKSAYLSLGLDAAKVCAFNVGCKGMLQELKKYIEEHPYVCPHTINKVLSAALEKNCSITCLNPVLLVSYVIGVKNSDYLKIRKILNEVMPYLLDECLFALTSKVLDGNEHLKIRRFLRVLIMTLTPVIVSMVARKVDIMSERMVAIETEREIAIKLLGGLITAITVETLGAIVAQGIQEDKTQKS